MMTIKLFELTGAKANQRFSPHCWKAHLALIHKGLSFDSIPVRYHEIETTLAFANYHLLPVLSDAEQVVTDSWNIACYLEEKYASQPSLFKSEAGKALAQSINHWCNTQLAQHIRPIILLSIYNIIDENDKEYFRKNREEKIGMSLEAFSEKAESAITSLNNELESIEEIISIQPYIGGDEPSYADICLFSTLLWISCVTDIEFLKQRRVVFEWYKRMLAKYPAVNTAIKILP